AAIRETYDIPREDNLKMRDFPTLAHVIQFVYDRRPDLAAAKPGAPAAGATQSATAAASAAPAAAKTVSGDMAAADAVPRRVPVPRLRPALDLCKPTGAALGKGSRVVVVSDAGGAGKALAGKLREAGVTPLVVETAGGAPSADALTQTLEGWIAEGPIQGLYWLPALDAPKAVADMDAADWREALRVRAKLLFAAVRALYGQLGAPGAFLVSAVRLGGRHGYDAAGAADPFGGAVTGLTKAVKRELGGLTAKAVDFEPGCGAEEVAEALLAETSRDPGAVEIGRQGGRRWTVGLAEQPVATPGTVSFGKDSVYVVTGAAGSIVSAIVADLAQAAGGGTFYLLDLAAKPDAANPDIARLDADREGLKRDIFARLKQDGARVTPVMVDKEIAALERAQAALAAIQAVEAAGGEAHYHSLNLLDTEAVKAVLAGVAGRHGKIDALIHAAGLEISRNVPDKKPSEFDLVFDVKADGWFNLLHGIGDTPVGAAVVFSSVAGRFGNAGQADYSAANDLLCKFVSSFRSSRPATRGLALDWTAWSGIGMASRGSIPAIMKAAGIDMLPPEAGIPVTRRELCAGTGAELVIGKRLGVMVGDFDATGGLDIGALKPEGAMLGKVAALGLYGGLEVETELDPAKQPFLDDHRIGGTPVLPGVMGVEAMAEAAGLLFPGLRVAAVEDVRFLAPFKFYRDQPRTVTVRVDYSADGADVVADCRLTGSRQLHGQAEPEVTTHFTGRVRLAAKAAKAGKAKVPDLKAGNAASAEDIYKVYFHGPAYRVMGSAWRSGDAVVARFAAQLPPDREPESSPLVAAPRLVELCFQASSLIGLAGEGRLGLPDGFRTLTVAAQPKGEVFAVVAAAGDGSYDVNVIDAKGKVYLALCGYRTMALPETVAEDLAAPLKQALQPQ
ncbi:MAG: SDR family NAD(P)-dependent oxidoreductase, partial [Acidobacteriota bacterium]|nr:SDR family NAD(P)-dependent oxidoreductase [Acidobacteriota bacterium]